MDIGYYTMRGESRRATCKKFVLLYNICACVHAIKKEKSN